jgi:hypothetical protein
VVRTRSEDDDDLPAETLRASNGDVDLADPDAAREEAAQIVASRAAGPQPAAIGRGLFDEHYGPGALERLMGSGLTVTRTRKQGMTFLFDLVGRDHAGQPDRSGSAVEVCDAGTNIQVKQKPPSPEMIALALVEVARLKGWPSINIETHGPLANEVRQHIKRLGVDVAEPGSRGQANEASAPRQRAGGLGMS